MTEISRQATTRRLYILTVNYYSSALVLDLVTAIQSGGDAEVEVLVVDNSPHDTGLDELSDRAGVILLRAEANLGFGAGCNLGLAHVQTRDPGAIVWLLNPDARLLPGAIATVRRALAESPRPAVLGTRIRDLEGRKIGRAHV